MTTHFIADPAERKRLVARLISVFATVLLLVSVLAGAASAKMVTYEITTDGNTVTVETEGDSVDSALDEAGIDLNATDHVASDESSIDGTVQVSVTHKQYATLVVDGAITSIQLEEGDTVADILDRLNVVLGNDDIVTPALDTEVVGGDSISVSRVEIAYYDTMDAGSFERYRQPDPDSYRGVEYLKQAGVPATTTYHHQVTVVDGGEPEDVITGTTTTEMKPQITCYGTRVSTPGLSGLSVSHDYITNIDDERKTITTKSGATYGFYAEKHFTCTAYTGGKGARTSTGRAAQVGVVAVDPSVIPYGTRMYIVSDSGSIVYGYAVAGDCGVHGQVIDLFMNSTSSCYAFGRRGMKVYFLN